MEIPNYNSGSTHYEDPSKGFQKWDKKGGEKEQDEELGKYYLSQE